MENTILNQQNEKEFADELSGITLRYISSVRFVIATRSILELERKVYTWLKIGITGACIWGRARIGKSYAVQYIAKVSNKNSAGIFRLLFGILQTTQLLKRIFTLLF